MVVPCAADQAGSYRLRTQQQAANWNRLPQTKEARRAPREERAPCNSEQSPERQQRCFHRGKGHTSEPSEAS